VSGPATAALKLVGSDQGHDERRVTSMAETKRMTAEQVVSYLLEEEGLEPVATVGAATRVFVLSRSGGILLRCAFRLTLLSFKMTSSSTFASQAALRLKKVVTSSTHIS
jgi:hypothetical protein